MVSGIAVRSLFAREALAGAFSDGQASWVGNADFIECSRGTAKCLEAPRVGLYALGRDLRTQAQLCRGKPRCGAAARTESTDAVAAATDTIAVICLSIASAEVDARTQLWI